MAVNLQPDPHSIFNASNACRQSFEGCLTITSLVHNEWAENRLAEFNLWAAGVGASMKQRASLDKRLAFETDVRDVVTDLLITLKAFIEECRKLGLQENDCGENIEFGRGRKAETETIPAEEPIHRSFSPWSDTSISDSGSEKEAAIPASNILLTQAMKNTEAILDQLARLAVAIRKPGTSSRLQKADRSFDPKHHEDLQNYLVLILLAKPSDIENKRHDIWDNNAKDQSVNFGVDIALLSTAQQHLIDANLRRRNRFIYAQRHARKLAPVQLSSTPGPVPKLEVVNQPERGPNIVMAESRARPLSPETKPVSAASALLIAHSDVTRMTDTTASAIATPFMFDLAPSTVMSQVSSTGLKTSYPNPPHLKELNSFKCPCCCLTLPAEFSENNRWRFVDSILNGFFTPTGLTDLILRKHIAQDLCPYTCFLNDCPRREVLYITRESWMNHVNKEHPSPSYWECFACDTAEKFHTAETFTAHVKEHQSISESHLPTLIDVCLRKTPHITSCPLCSWAEDQVENVDPKALFHHVAEHTHSFSLLSLPWAAATNGNEIPRISVEKVRNWFDTNFPTIVVGEEHQPCVDATNRTQNDDHYFDQNEYFAESSQRSGHAQNESDSSESQSKSTLSLTSSFGSKSGSTIESHKTLSNYNPVALLCSKDTAKDNGLNIWFDGDPDGNGSEIDVIAVPGLGAHKYYTWVERKSSPTQQENPKPLSKFTTRLSKFITRRRKHAQPPESNDAIQFSNNDRTEDNASKEVMWLRDLLPRFLPNARIATYSYQSDWRYDVKQNLRKCGEQLLKVLYQYRTSKKEARRPLILIGHSVGGLVIKQALVLANHGEIFKDLRLSVAGILFLGTPHQGSKAAGYGQSLARVLGSDTTLLESLTKHSQVLHEIGQDFETSYSNADLVCFHEEYDGPLGIKFVDFQSASLNGKRSIGLKTDHSGLNKFHSFEDENFQLLLIEIQRMVHAAQMTIERQFQYMQVNREIAFAKLPVAKGASFDSYIEEHSSKCLANTRVELQCRIQEWAKDANGKPIFWLNGMAGTGKSTIARTVARSFADEGHLGASFFFKKGEGDRGTASRFFTTIATDLMAHVPDLISGITKAIDADPAISKKALKDQFQKLILQPLLEIRQAPLNASRPIIVIDALDECERKEDIQAILYLLAQTKGLGPVSLRVFVTSRPDLPIRLGFKQMSDGT
ncbi:hypothetical protein MMC31_008056, partial [Peltigera leucophlebia]|nr:hypothetical protein [Peltigera leucophlebia]